MGRLGMAKKIMEMKAEIEKSDRNGMTPLSIAAYLGNLEMCRLLIGFGCSMSSVDKQNFTPLHHAAKNGHKDVCHLLTLSIGFAIEREGRRLSSRDTRGPISSRDSDLSSKTRLSWFVKNSAKIYPSTCNNEQNKIDVVIKSRKKRKSVF